MALTRLSVFPIWHWCISDFCLRFQCHHCHTDTCGTIAHVVSAASVLVTTAAVSLASVSPLWQWYLYDCCSSYLRGSCKSDIRGIVSAVSITAATLKSFRPLLMVSVLPLSHWRLQNPSSRCHCCCCSTNSCCGAGGVSVYATIPTFLWRPLTLSMRKL